MMWLSCVSWLQLRFIYYLRAPAGILIAIQCSTLILGVLLDLHNFIILIETSSSAIAERPRCRVSKLWQKYKSEKRASNIALSYGADVDK